MPALFQITEPEPDITGNSKTDHDGCRNDQKDEHFVKNAVITAGSNVKVDHPFFKTVTEKVNKDHDDEDLNNVADNVIDKFKQFF